MEDNAWVVPRQFIQWPAFPAIHQRLAQLSFQAAPVRHKIVPTVLDGYLTMAISSLEDIFRPNGGNHAHGVHHQIVAGRPIELFIFR